MNFADTYHGPVCDQTNKRVRRDQTQADDDSVSQSLQIFFVHACIDDKEENGGNWRWAGKRVFDGGIFWQELGGEVRVGDVLVVRRKRVT